VRQGDHVLSTIVPKSDTFEPHVDRDETQLVQFPEAYEPDAGFVKWRTFLRDVFVCSLGAYGGPEAHMGVFIDQMVSKKHYLTEDELVELMALCSILPGPTSTQTIVSIGYKTDGPLLALLTMLVWALPVLAVMTLLSFLYRGLAAWNVSTDILRFIGPMAVGFIVVAAFRIGRKVVNDTLTALLFVAGALMTYWIRAPWIFPVVLLAGGAISIGRFREPGMWKRPRIHPPWRYLAFFAIFAIGLLALSAMSSSRLVQLTESFYRYGYLVFGGGQVVVPVMHSELVQVREYMTNQEFLTGYGLAQGLPGPMFSFAAYAGGMAARGGAIWRQVLGAASGGVGIFLPGLLLIYFVYPVWEQLKQIRAIRIALRGINAVAGGLIAIAAVILMQAGGFHAGNLAVTAISITLLTSRKVPAPLIVAGALVAGFTL
jgi:chromate transporter